MEIVSLRLKSQLAVRLVKAKKYSVEQWGVGGEPFNGNAIQKKKYM